jgi:hypothetical protein
MVLVFSETNLGKVRLTWDMSLGMNTRITSAVIWLVLGLGVAACQGELHTGREGPDGATPEASVDAGVCPAGQVLRYEQPGCDSEAKPVCGPSMQDACFRPVCSCRGETISRCDFADEPFAAFGECATRNDGGYQPRLFGDWRWANPLPQGNRLTGTWGSSPNDVWGVGDLGTIIHWDGSAWAPVANDTPEG